MIKQGITRHVDHLGRIVLPAEIRRNMRIDEKSEFQIDVKGKNVITLTLVTPVTVEEAIANLKEAIAKNNQEDNIRYSDLLHELDVLDNIPSADPSEPLIY